jgi:undecaprenyl-diphosphatase
MTWSSRAWERLVAASVARPDPGEFSRRRGDGWAVAIGVLVAVGCSLAVRDGTVGELEADVFHAINGLPDVLEVPMWVLQLLGLLATPIILALVVLAVGRTRLAGGLVAAVPLKLFIERWVIKQLVERQRPGTTVPDAILRDAPVEGFSFPSGHAIFAFTIAGLLAPYLTRRWTIVVYVLAILNGVARIYLGAHNPLDIVGGGAVGVALAGLINLTIRVPAGRLDEEAP